MPWKPNLFIIGAAKSGTTSLHDELARHPDVFMTDPKEPAFFAPGVGYYPTEEAWYRGLFEGAEGSRYRGESSTHYTKLPLFEGVVERIAAFVDAEPRFIYVMRDPVERAVSNYWHNVRKHQEHRGMLEAFRDVPEYLAVSRYAVQLRPYLREFGRGALHATTFEEMVSDPDATVSGLYRWLGVDPSAVPPALAKRNVRPDRFTRVRGGGGLHRVAGSAVWARVSPFVPGWLKAAARRTAYRPASAADEDRSAAVAWARPRLADDVRELETLLDRTFEHWTTTVAGVADDRVEDGT